MSLLGLWLRTVRAQRRVTWQRGLSADGEHMRRLVGPWLIVAPGRPAPRLDSGMDAAPARPRPVGPSPLVGARPPAPPVRCAASDRPPSERPPVRRNERPRQTQPFARYASLGEVLELAAAAELAVSACLPLLPLNGSGQRGYTVSERIDPVLAATPEEWATAAHAIAELERVLERRPR